jgi:hypothetical protein
MLFDPRQDQVARDILAAAEIIKRDGWCQHRLYGPGTSVCINGAMIVAVFGRRVLGTEMLTFDFTFGENAKRVHAAMQHLEKHIGLRHDAGGYSAVPHWQDKGGRTEEEVLDAMCGSVGVGTEILA